MCITAGPGSAMWLGHYGGMFSSIIIYPYLLSVKLTHILKEYFTSTDAIMRYFFITSNVALKNEDNSLSNTSSFSHVMENETKSSKTKLCALLDFI